MRRTASATLGLMIALGFSVGAGSAQETASAETPAMVHMGHLFERFVGVPDNQGLFQVAMADARVAAQHARLGAQDPSNLEAMKTHAGHVIHALDPNVVENGPGSGYGLLRSAEGITTHARLAGRAAGGTAEMQTHSQHVAASANNTRRRADQLIALAITVRDHVETTENAVRIYADMQRVADELVSGVDADGDGQVGWQDREGGLAQVEQHLNFMRQAASSSGR